MQFTGLAYGFNYSKHYNNAFNLHKITKIRVKSQKYGRNTGNFAKIRACPYKYGRLSHTGFSPECFRMWTFRRPAYVQEYLHWAQQKGFSPLCTSMCIFRAEALPLECPHCLQLWSLLPACSSMFFSWPFGIFGWFWVNFLDKGIFCQPGNRVMGTEDFTIFCNIK